MKSIKAKVIALMLVVTLALTGCMQVEEGFKINSNGTGSLETKMTVEKQVIVDSYMESAKEMAELLGEKFNEAEALKEFESMIKESGMKEVTLNGKSYYQMTEKQNLTKSDFQEMMTDGSYITPDTVYLKFSNQDVEEFKQMAEIYGATMTADSVDLTVTIQLPKKIVATNGTIDKSNPNKVSFKVPVTKASTLFATTKSGVTTKTVADKIKKSNKISKPKIKSLKANKVKAKAKKASVTLKIKKVSGAKGYEIQYSTKKSFKGAKTKNIKKKTTYTIKNLKKGKKYYVRVRAYKNNYAGVKVTSKWVKKSVKTKKSAKK